MQNQYNTNKTELTYLYYNNLPEILVKFEEKLIARMDFIKIERPNPVKIFAVEQEDTEVFSIEKQYIIGKTLKSELIFEKELVKNELGVLKIQFHESTVSLMQSRATGFKNLSIPEECLSYDTYLNK